MRIKKINSINYGGKVIGIGLIFMLLISGLLLLFYKILVYEFLNIIAKVSFVIGLLILISFACLLMVELRQDKKLDQYYCKHRNIKIPIKAGKYECGACGNREVVKNSTCCGICGCRFGKMQIKR